MRVTDIDALMERLEITDECENCKWSAGPFCKIGSDFVDACEAIWEAPTFEIELFSEAVPRPNKNLVEVVRCKDCKYNLKKPRDYYDDDRILCFAWCPLISHLSEGEGWCFRGKRKDQPQTKRRLPDYSYEADLAKRLMEQTEGGDDGKQSSN